MAAQENGPVSKSQAIRDYLAEHPTAGPKEIVTALKEQGTDVTIGLASNVKTTSKDRKKQRRARRLAKSSGATVVQTAPEGYGSRSDAVRIYLAKNPDAGPKAVVDAISEQGMHISLALVHQVRRKLRGGVGPRGRSEGGPSITANDLFEVKKLANALGGLDNARRALELLEQLM